MAAIDCHEAIQPSSAPVSEIRIMTEQSLRLLDENNLGRHLDEVVRTLEELQTQISEGALPSSKLSDLRKKQEVLRGYHHQLCERLWELEASK